MRLKSYLLTALTAILLAGCNCDHTDLWKKINSNADRIKALEKWQEEVNSNLASLQQLLSTTDYITGVTPVTQSGVQVGYTIQFLHTTPITIYNGEKGESGAKGEKGEAGSTPQISVAQQADGNWYWTLNGEPLKDEAGNAIQANGTQGEQGEQGEPGTSAPAPQILLGSSLPTGITIKTDGGAKNDDAWYLSVDNKVTWYRINGTDGADGDVLFAKNGVDYTTSTEYVTFTLADNTPDDPADNPTLRIPLYKGIGITLTLQGSATALDLTQPLNVIQGNVLTYTLTGSDASVMQNDLTVSALMADGEGWTAKADRATKTITLSSTYTTLSATLVVMLTDNKDFSRSYTLPVKFAFEGKGTATEPYLLANAQALKGLATIVNAKQNYEGSHFKMTRDIDLADVCGKDLNDGAGIDWTPIGYADYDNDIYIGFEGTFDGDGHTISGLYINGVSKGKNAQALFGYIGPNATVKNFTLKGEVSGYQYISGIAAGNRGTISGCTNQCIVLANSATEEGEEAGYAGGITGENYGTIIDCHNEARITATDDYNSPIGGITGSNGDEGIIINCTNSATILSEGDSNSNNGNAGGISGNNRGTITGCTNTGNVTGIGYVGGITAETKGDIISGCINTGDITGKYTVGGITGSYMYGSLIACYNTGNVATTGSSYAGGIVGTTQNEITACYSTGNVSGPSGASLGGAIGARNNGAQSTCYWGIPGGSSLNGIGYDDDSSNPPVKVDGSTVQWTAGSGADNALATMNAAIDTWNANQTDASLKCNYKYEANSDAATGARTPLVLKAVTTP